MFLLLPRSSFSASDPCQPFRSPRQFGGFNLERFFPVRRQCAQHAGIPNSPIIEVDDCLSHPLTVFVGFGGDDSNCEKRGDTLLTISAHGCRYILVLESLRKTPVLSCEYACGKARCPSSLWEGRHRAHAGGGVSTTPTTQVKCDPVAGCSAITDFCPPVDGNLLARSRFVIFEGESLCPKNLRLSASKVALALSECRPHIKQVVGDVVLNGVGV
ncbi:hypothetical protein QFZ34_000377 [Phyllobacterium ifriqiyense]|uniref:Uncharacterized protein n=1 Tax=Phyllobacterium ifriqiyense TaxID=314238 RepID=A0ABU0S5K7_9HYPH|nr:hypothetical protein [Phyllobacterium ifriqiyense]